MTMDENKTWLSVERDGYPEEGEHVLALTRQGKAFVGYYDGKDYRNIDIWRINTTYKFQTMTVKVAYWQPIPALPEEFYYESEED